LQDHRVLVHTSLQPIRWGDMDMLGHVNNTVYLRYMEKARIDWIDTLARGQGCVAGRGPVIVNASCNFRAGRG
jgi:acyl-CoA thioester hydrolase